MFVALAIIFTRRTWGHDFAEILDIGSTHLVGKYQ
jgi:hypothetical protein